MYRNNGQAKINNFFDELLSNGMHKVWNEAGKVINEGYAPVNIRETEANYELSLAAPGLSKEAFKISVDKNVLTISYQPAEENIHTNEGKWLRKEFNKTAFKRSFTLNDKTDPQAGITAKYVDGILTLNIPKKTKEETEAVVISVD